MTLGREGEVTYPPDWSFNKSKWQAFPKILFLIGYRERQLPERPGRGGNVSNPKAFMRKPMSTNTEKPKPLIGQEVGLREELQTWVSPATGGPPLGGASEGPGVAVGSFMAPTLLSFHVSTLPRA